MKRYICALLSAALLMLSAMPAAAENNIDKDSEVVTFIVGTAGTPVAELETNMRSLSNLKTMTQGYIDRHEEELETQNREILADVAKKLGVSAEESYVYTQLSSGFSITARRGDMEKILATDGVTDVCEAVELYTVPDDEISSGEVIASAAATAEYKGEGTAIAIIDTGFNITHEYFQTAPSEPKYSQADAESLISETGRGIYYNAKLPFVYDYYQKSTATAAVKNYADHGTHVAGIAAGSGGTLPNGDMICGNAPEAQLALMAIGVSATGIDMNAAIAALDDCYKLKVDVINMSFGGKYRDMRSSGFTQIATSIQNARNAGIAVCVAAGNDARGYSQTAPSALDPDYGAVGAYGKLTDTFSVASADAASTYSTLTDIVLDNGSVMAGLDFAANGVYFKDAVQTETQIIDCGLASTAADCVGASGKVAIIQRGGNSFEDKTNKAKNAGAIAAIIYDNRDEPYPSISGQALPTLFMTKQDGEALLAGGAGAVRVNGESVHRIENSVTGGTPSSFSSWGISETLELIPNIMGYGGNIYSSGTASDTAYVLNSGTSMASPYIAGVCACIKSYINAIGGADSASVADMIEQRLTSTAVPARYAESHIAYSPRLQGAGLVDPQSAVATPVTLKNDNEKTLVNLGNKLSASFDISFTAHNYSMEDILFDDISVEVMTDDHTVSGGKNYVGQMKSLTVKSYTTDAVTAEADSDTPVTISVTLDSDELQEQAAVFGNGFYIDGYIRLSNSDYSVGIPFMGFFGDWRELPMFDKTRYDTGGSALAGTYLRTTLGGTNKTLGTDTQYMIISPKNGDGRYDSLTAVMMLYRGSHGMRLSLMQNGVEMNYRAPKSTTAASGYMDKFTTYSMAYTNISALADGEYTVRLTGYFDDGRMLTPKTLDFPRNIIIDNTAPQVSATLSRDKTQLYVKASDANYLQSVTVSYTDLSGAVKTETVTPTGAVTEYEHTFTVTDPKGAVTVTAVDYAYNTNVATPSISVTPAAEGATVSISNAPEGYSAYAAKYDSRGILTDIAAVSDGSEIDFQPDKVFLWNADMTPVTMWERQQ